MTNIEAKKIAKVLGIKDFYIDSVGVVCVNLNNGEHGPVFIFTGKSFRNALPLRMLKRRQQDDLLKQFIEYLLKQSADGIRCAMLRPGEMHFNLVNAYETAESLLVKHDLKFYKKNKKAKRSKS